MSQDLRLALEKAHQSGVLSTTHPLCGAPWGWTSSLLLAGKCITKSQKTLGFSAFRLASSAKLTCFPPPKAEPNSWKSVGQSDSQQGRRVRRRVCKRVLLPLQTALEICWHFLQHSSHLSAHLIQKTVFNYCVISLNRPTSKLCLYDQLWGKKKETSVASREPGCRCTKSSWKGFGVSHLQTGPRGRNE